MIGRSTRGLWIAVLILWPVLALADLPPASQTVRQAIDELYRTLDQTGCDVRNDPERLHEVIERVLLPYTDMRAMARWVLGRHWRAASPEQRARFESAFRRLLVRTYGAAVREARPDDIRFLPERAGSRDTRRVVRTEIKRRGAPPVPVDYYMHLVEGRWRLYDVRIEGVSLITNYRGSFANIIAGHGLDGLIERLDAKTSAPAP